VAHWQAESFPPTENAISNEFVIVFSSAGGRARGKATINTFVSNATAIVVAEHTSALLGLAVRGKPAMVAALIANHPDDVLSIELNGVVRKTGAQDIYRNVPVSPDGSKPPGLWGLDRIDQVCANVPQRGHGPECQNTSPMLRLAICFSYLSLSYHWQAQAEAFVVPSPISLGRGCVAFPSQPHTHGLLHGVFQVIQQQLESQCTHASIAWSWPT
jgi:hypothetical protein